MHQSHIIAVGLLWSIFLKSFGHIRFHSCKGLIQRNIEMHFSQEGVTTNKIWNSEKLSIKILQDWLI